MGEVVGAGDLLRDHEPSCVDDELAGFGRLQRGELGVDPVEPQVPFQRHAGLHRLAGDERGTLVLGDANSITVSSRENAT